MILHQNEQGWCIDLKLIGFGRWMGCLFVAYWTPEGRHTIWL